MIADQILTREWILAFRVAYLSRFPTPETFRAYVCTKFMSVRGSTINTGSQIYDRSSLNMLPKLGELVDAALPPRPFIFYSSA